MQISSNKKLAGDRKCVHHIKTDFMREMLNNPAYIWIYYSDRV